MTRTSLPGSATGRPTSRPTGAGRAHINSTRRAQKEKIGQVLLSDSKFVDLCV